jgi:DNA-binding HxlR family transcriptional regulator
MNWFRKPPSTDCPVERCLDLVGNKWQLCIIWKLRERAYGFGELSREIPDISRKVLSQQLRELQKIHFITRTELMDGRGSVSYELSETGHSFSETLDGVAAWATSNEETVSEKLSVKYAR